MGLVPQKLNHDELVSLVAREGEEEGVELREPLLHGGVGLGGDHGRHAILAGEMVTPDLLNLLASFLREKFQLDNGVERFLF